MSVNKIVVVGCDGLDPNETNPYHAKRCPAFFLGEVAEPRDVVIHRAKNHGWNVKDGGAWHYCPTCAVRLTREWLDDPARKKANNA